MATMHRVGSTATVIGYDGYPPEGFNFCQYHATKVVRWNDRKIILNSNGWRTNTTKARMNQVSNQFGLGFQVYQKDFNWFVRHGLYEYPFHDNIELIR